MVSVSPMRHEVITRTRGVFIHIYWDEKRGNFFVVEMNSKFEAPPVPDEERSSSPILGAGVLDVPPEIWGHFHEPFPRCPNCLVLRTLKIGLGFLECVLQV